MTEQPGHEDRSVQLKLISRKMVHSLNNMLFVISSYSEFVRETHCDEETAENIRNIQEAADECQRIMTDWRQQADRLIPDPPGT